MLLPAGLHNFCCKVICMAGLDEVDGASPETAAHHARAHNIKVAGNLDKGIQFRATDLEVIAQ